jgi:hypothetical protein
METWGAMGLLRPAHWGLGLGCTVSSQGIVLESARVDERLDTSSFLLATIDEKEARTALRKCHESGQRPTLFLSRPRLKGE